MKKILRLLKYKTKYYLYSFLNIFVKKDEFKIFIHDKYFKKDNAWEIANYIASNKELEKYTIYYYTDYPLDNYSNIVFLGENDDIMYNMLRSKNIIYSYRADGVNFFKSSHGQKIVDTMHGSPLKKIGYKASSSRLKKLWRYDKTFDYILSVSDFFTPIIQDSFDAKDTQVLTVGYPRNDILANPRNEEDLKTELYSSLKINEDSTLVLWMSTWRQSKDSTVKDSSIAFPIIKNSNVKELNVYLQKINMTLVIKIHPFQEELEIFSGNHSNIKILTNPINELVNFYHYIPLFEALITDYSSIIFDYLLVEKPIAFAIEDYEEYQEKRGFTVEHPIELMPGHKLYNLGDLKEFLDNLKLEQDAYKAEREKVSNIVNKYSDSKSTERLLEHLGIK